MLLHLKDYFTLGNAFSGFLSIVFVIRGDLEWAGYMIPIAYAFDISDGMVARLTKTFNKFGAELDNVADLVAYSIAPSFLIYGYYTINPVHDALPWWLAAAIASLPTLTGCIRFARFNVKRLHYDGAWFGFPRPASGLLFVGYFNMTVSNSAGSFDLFGLMVPYKIFYWFGIFVVIYASAMHFVLVPFYNHHQKGGLPLFMKTMMFFIFTSLILAGLSHILTGYSIIWEVLVFWFFAYLFFHRRFAFPPKERKKIAAFIKEWKKDELDV